MLQWINRLWRPLKIEFLVIGAQKCGTTSLYSFLSTHPDICPSKEKELGYFWNDKKFRKGDHWYRAQFKRPFISNPFRPMWGLDVTPEYLYFFEITAKRIRDFNPEMRLIVSLRDPVERAYSAYNMYAKIASSWICAASNPGLAEYLDQLPRYLREPFLTFIQSRPFPTFPQAIATEISSFKSNPDFLEQPSIVKGGLYVEHLQGFLKYFDMSSILVLDSRQLRDSRTRVMQRVCKFLNLSEVNWGSQNLADKHVASYQDPLDSHDASTLREFYKPYNERLYALIGTDFGW